MSHAELSYNIVSPHQLRKMSCGLPLLRNTKKLNKNCVVDFIVRSSFFGKKVEKTDAYHAE